MFRFITKMLCLALVVVLSMSTMFAQQRTSVNAKKEVLSSVLGTPIMPIQNGLVGELFTSQGGRGAGTAVYSTDFEGTTSYNLPTGWVRNPSPTNINGAWGGTANLNSSIGMPPHGGSRYAGIVTYQSTAVDAWMMTPSMNFTAGTTYAISWWMVIYGEEDGSDNDVLDIRINSVGNSIPNMNSGTSIYFTNTEVAFSWVLKTVSYTATVSGNHWIGFHCTTPTNTGWFIGIDDFAVAPANANDIAVTAAYPYSQVPINQKLLPTITAQAKNVGYLPQNNVTFSLNCNGTPYGPSTPVSTLAPGATADLTVNTPNVSIPIGTNTLTYSVAQTQTDDDPSDNTITRTFTGTGNTFATDNGTMASYYSANVTYGTIYTFTEPVTLFQTAVYFYTGGAAATYTINVFEMTGPTTTAATALFTSAAITRPTTTAWSNYTLPTPLAIPAGSYYVCVTPTGTGASYILADGNAEGRVGYSKSGTALSVISRAFFLRLTVDLKVNDIQCIANGFPYTQIPTSQASALPFPTLSGKAYNAGTAAQTNVKLSATYNGAPMGTSTPIASLAFGVTSANMTVTPPTGTVFPTTSGATGTVVYAVSQDQTDEFPSDNTQTYTFNITDDIYAIDGPIDLASGGVGYSTSPNARIGNYFTIANTVVLSQVMLAFNTSLPGYAFNIQLYERTGPLAISATPIFTQPAVKVAGWMTVNVSDVVLPPGNYFLCVQQNSAGDNIGILYDGVAGRVCYGVSTGTGTALTEQTTFGSLGIRMVVADPPTLVVITTAVSPAGTGTVTGGGTYVENATVTLTATPNFGYNFVEWQDGNTNNPRTITATENATYTAYFVSDGCQSATIGTSTTTSGYQIPVNTYYNHSYVQHIFTAEEIGGAGMITSVSFQYILASSNVKNNQTYYLGFTTKNTFASASDWVPLSELTQVFAGTVVYDNTNTWFTIQFDTPFDYNQPDCNLVLAVLNNHGSYSSGSSATFRYTAGATGVNRTLHSYVDAAPINPAAPASGTLSVNRSNTLFRRCPGATTPPCNPPTNLIVKYTFDCEAKLTWTPAVGGACNPYDIYRDGTIIAPGVFGSSYTDTGFDPLVGHTWKIVTICGGNESTAATIALGACETNANCEKTSSIGTGTTGVYTIPVNTYYNYSYSQQIFLAEEIGEAGEMMAVAFRYIYTSPTTKSPLTVYVGNTSKTVFASTSDWVPLSQMTQVFTGSVTFENGWAVIDFNVPFEYIGCNLVVAVLNSNGGYDTGSSSTFYVTAAGASRTLHYYTDNAPIDPASPPTASGALTNRNNIRFKICDRESYVPQAPVTTTATDVLCTSFTANWGSVSGATGYLLSVYTGSTYILNGVSVGNVTNYQITNLLPGTTYNYFVKTVEFCTTSDPSDEIEVATLPVYTIVASANAGGSITPTGTIVLGCQVYTQTYTFAANSGYAIEQVLIDGVNDPAAVLAGTYTFDDIDADHTIEIVFIPTHIITATAGIEGTINPSGMVIVMEGYDQTFTFVANGGYIIDQVLIDGVNDPAAVLAGTYTFENVTENRTIKVTFIEYPSYTITAYAGLNGYITPNGIIIVNQGDDKTFYFAANSGYEIYEVLIDGVNDPAAVLAGEYTFENIQTNHAIAINFKAAELALYTITTIVGTGGSINPSGVINVMEGHNQTFTFAAQNGYYIDEVLIDNIPDAQAKADGYYTFENVTADHLIEIVTVAFEPGEYVIHTTYGAGGSISPNGDVYVPVGAAKTFIITPKQGYKIDQVWVDEVLDTQAIIDKSYTFTNVQEEHWLSATFTYISIEQYYINATASTVGGTITPSGKVLVTTGDDKKFAFTPQAGYQIKEVLVDGVNDLPAVVAGEYTFYDIVCAHTIEVKFEKQTFVIAASITTAGGTIAPLGESTVTYGGSKAYTITAQTGYLIDEVLVDGIYNATAVSSGKYTFSNVVGTHTIEASFKQREYEITATQTLNGTVTPAGVTTVLHGNNMTYNITPNAGYMIKTVLVDGKNNTSAVALGFYTFTNVTAKHTITATYVPTTGAPVTGEGSELSLYPNPTSGELRVLSLGFNVTGIEVFDVLGRKVQSFEFKVSTNPEPETVINISHLPNGVYFVRIKTETDVVMRKVVKD